MLTSNRFLPSKTETSSRRDPQIALPKLNRLIGWLAVCGALSGGSLIASDLSHYRDFRFGTTLAAVAKQAQMDPSVAKVVQQRPALIQVLTWRPQSFGPSSANESVKDVILSFYNGDLFQILVNYDRYRTEGLTSDDLIETLSATYGATSGIIPALKAPQPYGDSEEIAASWEDPDYSLKLVRRSYGPSFALIAVRKAVDTMAQASIAAAAQLDEKEAPQREAARRKSEADADRSKEENARLKNKPNFRP